MIRGRVPAPLAWLLGATAVLVVVWAFVPPPWQSPDEFAHFGYATEVAEKGRLPDGPGRPFSTEMSGAITASRANETARSIFARPQWSRSAYDQWRAAAAREPGRYRRDGGSSENTASSNPPLYYFWVAIPYRLAHGADVLQRLYLMRIWSGLLLLASVVGTWLLVGEAVGRRRSLQVAGASVVALEPMATFISASVNPDAALTAVGAFTAWLGVKILRRGPTRRRVAALMAVLAVGLLTKATAYLLVPPAGLALLVGWWRSLRAEDGSHPLPGPVALVRTWWLPLAAGVVPVVAWLAYSRIAGRMAVNGLPDKEASGQSISIVSYLWQFYLPTLPGQTPLHAPPSLPLLDQWVKGGWAAFGWLEVRFATWVYWPVMAFVGASAAGAVAAAWRRRREIDWAVPAFLVAIVVVLLIGLHYVDFRFIRAQGEFNTQGRYLLPALPVLGVCFAAALSMLREAPARLALGGVVGGLFAFQIASLALEMSRYYAA